MVWISAWTQLRTSLLAGFGSWTHFQTKGGSSIVWYGVMARFVGRLDAGGKLYSDPNRKSPRPFEVVAGKPCIAAVPERNLFTIPEVCGVTSRSKE
jgi:hypothetical protein